jgi:hypothetical protein
MADKNEEKDIDMFLVPLAKAKLSPAKFDEWKDALERMYQTDMQEMVYLFLDRMAMVFPETMDHYKDYYEDEAHGGIRSKRSQIYVERLNRS